MIPRYLQEFVREGKVIPFVGAGVSISVKHKDGPSCFPSWAALLYRAAERLREESKADVATEVEDLLGAGDYMEASTRARKALRSNWYRFLKSQFSFTRREIDSRSLALAQAIWGIGSRLVITTNYDRVLMWACPELPDLHRWDIDAPYEQIAALRDGVEAPTVWHLHGLIDNVTKLILTPDGYHRLYPDPVQGASGDAKRRHEAALRTLQRHLASFSFLFIGFSLDDAAFLDQLQQVDQVFEGAAATHYILVREAEREQMVEKIDGWGLPIDVVPFAEFGPPLIEKVHEIGRYTLQPAPEPEPEPEPETPTGTVPASEEEAREHEESGEYDEYDDDVLLDSPSAAPVLRKSGTIPTPTLRPPPSKAPAGDQPRSVTAAGAGPRPAPVEVTRGPVQAARSVASSDAPALPFEVTRGPTAASAPPPIPREPAARPERDVPPLDRLRTLSPRLYSAPLSDRRVAARSIAELSRRIPAVELLALCESGLPDERVAAGIGLRTHLELDPSLGNSPAVRWAIERGLEDQQPRVRYRFAETLLTSPPLAARLRPQLERLFDDEHPFVASKAREVSRITTTDAGGSEPDA